MAKAKVQEFLDALGTYDHKRGMDLFEASVKDFDTAQTATLGVLLAAANQKAPEGTTPHALLTAESGRRMLALVGWPASLPVVRFLALYTFTLTRRDWTPKALERTAARLKIAQGARLPESLARAVSLRKPEEAAAVAVALARREGLPAAGRALVAASLGDVGKLHHNLVLAAAHADAAEALGEPAGFVALAAGGFELAARTEPGPGHAIEPLEPPPAPADPSLERLDAALFDDDFDEVHAQLKGFAASGIWEDAFRPLLIAACLEPGFLGHSLIAAHHARLAATRLTAEERAFLLWKVYRTLVHRFGYPEGLRLSGGPGIDPAAAVEALKSSLKVKTPPVERTLRDALESGVPLEKVLQHVAYNWTHWTVGEKEHTLQYLSAAVQTAAFLGKEQAMAPLVSSLYKLPF